MKYREINPDNGVYSRDQLTFYISHLFEYHENVQTYVQDLAAKEADAIYRLIVSEEGHIYVCGDVTMAEHVYLTIRYVANIVFTISIHLDHHHPITIFMWQYIFIVGPIYRSPNVVSCSSSSSIVAKATIVP